MGRFRFALEPVLLLRRRQEEDAELELGRRRRRLEEERARLEELRRELRRHDEHRALLRGRGTDARALADGEAYAETLHRAARLQEQALAEAEAGVAAAAEALRLRRQDREAIERLREEHLTRHRSEELGREQQALDEAAMLRWRQARRTGAEA
jgi:flagellar protein FliJ